MRSSCDKALNTGETSTIFLATVPPGVATDGEVTAGHTIEWGGVGAFSGMVIKSDPGQRIIWLAFGLLIVGLALTFYFPRRRAWARMCGSNVALAFTADRYVDQDAEFGRLTDEVEERLATKRPGPEPRP